MSATAVRAERDVEVAGLRLKVREQGTGPVVVVLHHSTGPFWTPFYDQLAESFTVVAPDMPGFGHSERPVTARSPRDLAILCLQFLTTLDATPVHLLGFGLGGWVAAEMATMSQQTFSTLTLVGAAGLKPQQSFIHDPMMSGWIEYARLGFSTDGRFDEMFGEDPADELLELWDYSREMTARITWRPWMWSGQLPAMIRGVRTPTLVAWGDTDRIMPLECGEQYVDLLPDARLEIIESAGHVLDVEQPEALASLVTEFLAMRGR